MRETVARLGVSDAKQAGRVVGEIMKANKGKVEAGDRQADRRRRARGTEDLNEPRCTSESRRDDAGFVALGRASHRSTEREPGRQIGNRRVAVARLAPPARARVARSAGAASQIACARLNAVCSRTPPSAVCVDRISQARSSSPCASAGRRSRRARPRPGPSADRRGTGGRARARARRCPAPPPCPCALRRRARGRSAPARAPAAPPPLRRTRRERTRPRS